MSRFSTNSCCLRYCKSTSFQANHNRVSPRKTTPRVVCDTAKVRVFKQITTVCQSTHLRFLLFAILQKYEFSSKSQRPKGTPSSQQGCLRYCKSTSFQANHNNSTLVDVDAVVVCDTAKVRVFKQITTVPRFHTLSSCCLRYCKSTSFQANHNEYQKINAETRVVCDTAKVRVFKQITTISVSLRLVIWLFAILQKYEFSSKSQLFSQFCGFSASCLRYCKSTSFQANHNPWAIPALAVMVVCDTAKVRVFKQITTRNNKPILDAPLFAILQKYEFSSKSQHEHWTTRRQVGCLRYCKSTSFQANHNPLFGVLFARIVVCDTAKVRVFKQITTIICNFIGNDKLFAILQKYEFSSKSQLTSIENIVIHSCLRYCKSTSFQANHNLGL